jgi:phosphoglycerate dehydrogenase-like enzyme
MNPPSATNPKPKVYIHRVGEWYPRYMNDANERDLASFAEVVSDGPLTTPLSADYLVKKMSGCSSILSLGGGGAHEITGDVLKTVGTIKVICIAHWCEQLVGAAKEGGVTVVEGSNANTLAVAEWTVAAALLGVRRLHRFNDALKAGFAWAERRYAAGLLCESTVGLIGLGRIGRACASYFRAMGAKVIAYDKYWTQPDAEKLGITLVPLDDLLTTADIVSLHLPVLPGTRGLLGAREFALIKDGAVFINSARAALYDEAALIAELRKARFSAFLDVFAEEPVPLDHPFRSMDHVLINPHIAGDNRAMSLRCGREAIATLRDYYAGKGLRDLKYAL